MSIITFLQLQELTGYKQPAEVAACLGREGVEFFTGKHGRPYTFEPLFLAAKGITPQTSTSEPKRLKPRIEMVQQ